MKPFDLLILILFGLLFILFSPIILLVAAYVYIKSLIGRLRFRRYLATNEGATFFAYTNKASSKAYVEQRILPFLSHDTKIFYLAGKKGRVNMGDDFGLLAYVVSVMRETPGGFPYVSKIENGELVTESINNRLYSAIRRGVEADQMNERIARFYSN
jgi:hypothetical protein